MKQIIPIILIIFTISGYAQQDYEEWQKQQQQGLAAEQAKFEKFKSEQDSLFVEFLKSEWQAYSIFKGLVLAEKPKPKIIPKTTPHAIPEQMTPEPSKEIKKIYEPMLPMEKKTEWMEIFQTKKEQAILPFTFFNSSLRINYDEQIKKLTIGQTINQQTISKFWSELSKTEYEEILKQTERLGKEMKLNDWGRCLLLYNIGKELFKDSMNEQILFTWFILMKAGFDAKVGYAGNNIYLLLPSKNTIYRMPFFMIDNNKYYVVAFENVQPQAEKIYSYNANHPKAQQFIALNIKDTPIISQKVLDRNLNFNYNDKPYQVNITLKNDVIDFFTNYPQTELQVYFNALLSPQAHYSLIHDLKPIIEGKSEIEAVNILLRFVQTAFQYKNDETQFGKEKPLFAEETLFYEASDCEDRSVLFAYLVQNLVGLAVIALDYPEHIATAVNFSTDIIGDSVEYNGDKYVICDATYINANVGQCMERFKNIQPNIIPLQ